MTQAESSTLMLEMLRQFREDYAQDQQAAAQTRSAMRQRLDEVVDRLGRMETTAAISGSIEAQVRNELDGLTRKLTEVEPVAVDWNRVKSIGKWAAGGLLAGGVGVGALAASAGDQAVSAIRTWLRIP